MANHITGRAAITYAREHGIPLNCYTSPIEEARDNIDDDYAAEIASEDPGLLWCEGRGEASVDDAIEMMIAGGVNLAGELANTEAAYADISEELFREGYTSIGFDVADLASAIAGSHDPR